MLRTGQQRLIAGLRGLGDQHGAAVVIALHDKARRHIVAQQRDIGAWVPSVSDSVPPVWLLFGK